MLFLENLCNQFPGLCALLILEETPSTLPLNCLTDGLTQFTRQYCVMVALGYCLILLLSSADGPALPGRPIRLSVSYQAFIDTPLLEVHLPGDPGLDLSGPTDAQSLREDNVGKAEGPLVVIGPHK